MVKEIDLSSRISPELQKSPDAYRSFFEKNFGEQPGEKFASVSAKLREGSRTSAESFALKLGRVGDHRVLLGYSRNNDNGTQNLHAEITSADQRKWIGTVTLQTMTGIAVPSFSEHGPEVEEDVLEDIYPNDPLAQGRAVFSILNYMETIIPQMAEITAPNTI